jgi:hypothetical protein
MADRDQSLERYVKIASILIAVATFVFGVVQFSANERAKRVEQARQDRVELAQKEAAAKKPYLDRQLQLYADAARSAAVLATSSDQNKLNEARARFLELYWGELAMVEDRDVDIAMHEFELALEAGVPQEVLQVCSIRLSHLLRKSLSSSFGAKVWTSPYKVEPYCLQGR